MSKRRVIAMLILLAVPMLMAGNCDFGGNDEGDCRFLCFDDSDSNCDFFCF